MSRAAVSKLSVESRRIQSVLDAYGDVVRFIYSSGLTLLEKIQQMTQAANVTDMHIDVQSDGVVQIHVRDFVHAPRRCVTSTELERMAVAARTFSPRDLETQEQKREHLGELVGAVVSKMVDEVAARDRTEDVRKAESASQNIRARRSGMDATPEIGNESLNRLYYHLDEFASFSVYDRPDFAGVDIRNGYGPSVAWFRELAELKVIGGSVHLLAMLLKQPRVIEAMDAQSKLNLARLADTARRRFEAVGREIDFVA